MKTCSVADCDRPNHSRGLCARHYQHFYKRAQLPPIKTREQRFWSKVEFGDCWTWTAGLDTYGYGTFWVPPTMSIAHRVAWQWLIGPIPDGLELDHLCRNRRCVNPDHLEPVTHGENIRRSWPYRLAASA